MKNPFVTAKGLLLDAKVVFAVIYCHMAVERAARRFNTEEEQQAIRNMGERQIADVLRKVEKTEDPTEK